MKLVREMEETMIHDRLENLLKYIPTDKREKVERFITKISVDMDEGFYEIDGKEIYARIMSYKTKLENECLIEAHDSYIDIQFSLIGEEGISIYPRNQLCCVSSDSENDFNTFDETGITPQIKVCNMVGWFTFLETSEAHRPQESVDGKCEIVKKGVIKIKGACYE